MKPPKINPKKIYSNHELATRWLSYECFLRKLPAFVRKALDAGEMYTSHSSTIDLVNGYVVSGELIGRNNSSVELTYTSYSISGASIATLENEQFGLDTEGEALKENFHPCQDEDSEFYAPELDIALQAWSIVVRSNHNDKEGTPKQRLDSWLRNSGYSLSEKQIERICIVCNFDKSAGRPKPNK